MIGSGSLVHHVYDHDARLAWLQRPNCILKDLADGFIRPIVEDVLGKVPKLLRYTIVCEASPNVSERYFRSWRSFDALRSKEVV